MSLVERAAFAGPAADVALPAALDLAGFQIIGCGGGRIENMLSDGLQPTIYLDWVTPYGPPDVEYMKPRVDQMHARGAKYMGYYSFGHLEGRGPEYFPTVTTDGVALDLDGNTVKADAGDDPALSITRPATRQMLLEVTKLAIDAGTDYVVYDVAFANQFPLAAGSFDPDAMAAFRTYLSANYSQAELDAMFGQSVDISTFDYREYLRARGVRASTISRNPGVGGVRLYVTNHWRAWRAFLAGFERDFFAQLQTESQAYARDTYGRDFGVTFNRYGFQERPASRWVSAPYAAFDAGEVWFPGRRWRYVLGKTMEPVYRANLNTSGNRFWAWNAPLEITPTNDVAALWLAEGLANGGIPQCLGGPVLEFAKSHPEVLGLNPVADLAVLYPLATVYDWSATAAQSPEGANTHFWYLGAGYLLGDSHWNYDVVFAGDGRHVADTFKLSDVSSYPAVVLPQTVRITDAQFNVLIEYVRNGGHLFVIGDDVVRFDENRQDRSTARGVDGLPWAHFFELLGASGEPNTTQLGAGSITVATLENILSLYFEDHRQEGFLQVFRDKWEEAVAGIASPAVSTTYNHRVHIGRFRDSSDGSELYHLVNYTLDGDFKVQTLSDGRLTVPAPPDYTGGTLIVSYMSVDSPEPTVLSDQDEDAGTITVVIPSLPVYGVLKVGSAAAAPKAIDYLPYSYLASLFDYEWWRGDATRSLEYTAADDHGLESIRVYYRYSTDGQIFEDWAAGPIDSSASGNLATGVVEFDFPRGEGLYRVQLRATDGAGQD